LGSDFFAVYMFFLLRFTNVKKIIDHTSQNTSKMRQKDNIGIAGVLCGCIRNEAGKRNYFLKE